jgi:hypothetical protein
MYEGIYLIQEREFIKTEEEVYTLGRSHNLQERIKQYPKESNLLLIILCKNSVEIEKELIKLLTKNFTLCSNYGAEYFKGKFDKINLVIENYFKNIKSLFCKITNSSTNKFNFNYITNSDNNNILTKTIYPKNNEINEEEDVEDNNEDNNEEDNNEEDNNEDDINEEEDDEEDEDDDEDNNEDKKDNKLIVINNFGIVTFAQEFKNDKRIKHICKYCDYSTPKFPSYRRHLTSNKHKNNYKINNINNINKNDTNTNNNLIKENNILAKENKQLMNKLIKLLKENK